MTERNRRTFLVLASSAAVGALAGCIDVGALEPSDNDDAIVATAIDTVEATCAGDEQLATDHEIDGQVVTVQGNRHAPTPCYDAVIEAANFDNGTLVLDVASEAASEGDEACIHCHGLIEYEATVELAGDVTVDEVVVDHVD